MSKKLILSALRTNLPAPCDLPALPAALEVAPVTSIATFRSALEAAGGTCLEMSNENAVRDYAAEQSRDGRLWVSDGARPGAGRSDANWPWDVSVSAGQFGVVENGAIWVDGDALNTRRALFLCRHLILTLPAQALVPTMHEAYARIRRPQSFGCFIAGPSKTADIEQCLVIGAHAAKALTVVFMETIDPRQAAR